MREPSDATDGSAAALDVEQGTTVRHLLSPVLLALTGLVVTGGVVLRWWDLGHQSYWTDELFSVQQGASGLQHAWDVGLDEIHPPLYAVLLTGWEALGGARGTTLTWTRSLSALLGCLTVLASWWSLRRAPLSSEARALAVALIAASGFAVVYAQETRSYSLLLLAATGLTAATVSWALAPRAARPRALPLLPWALWGLLASLTHLFGLVLALACAVVLVVVRRRWSDSGLVLLLVLLVAAPQVAWIVPGSTRPAFAQGTGWIRAPDLAHAGELVTSVFASGDLRPDTDGFPWVSGWGVVVACLILVAAAVAGLLTRPRGRTDPEDLDTGHSADLVDPVDPVDPTDRTGALGATGAVAVADAVAEPASPVDDVRDGEAAAVLLLLSGLLLVGVYVVSQSVHLWTTRNLIVVVPALSWGAGFLALHLAGRLRAWCAAVILVALGASLVLVGVGLRPAYKTDFRGTVAYLTAQRFERPDVTFVVSSAAVPTAWFLSTDEPVVLPDAADAVFSRAVLVRRTGFLERVRPVPGPAVYVFYPDVAARETAEQTAGLIARVGGPDVCTPVAIHGMVVVRCDP